MAQSETFELPANYSLTVTADAGSAGTIQLIATLGVASQNAITTVAAGTTSTVSPSPFARNFRVLSTSGTVVWAIAADDADNDDFTGTTEIEEFSGFASNLTTVSSTQTKSVSASAQAIVYGTLTITGILEIAGEMRIGAWPF